MIADVLSLPTAAEEARERAVRDRARLQRLTENLMFAADEITEALRERRRSLTCPRHITQKSQRPSLCPICALVECRRPEMREYRRRRFDNAR